jgi:hypothetical protein
MQDLWSLEENFMAEIWPHFILAEDWMEETSSPPVTMFIYTPFHKLFWKLIPFGCHKKESRGDQ